MAIFETRSSMPIAVYALTAGAFGIGTTEFVIMGLLQQVASDLGVGIAKAGMLISGYALGVFVGAPLLTATTARLPRKTVLVALMVVFTLGNIACALAPNYPMLMAARVFTSLAHGTFFGVGAVVATELVEDNRKASAIAVMFTGLAFATLLGVPAGAWLGLHLGWRATFWAVAMVGVVATTVIAALVPASRRGSDISLRSQLSVARRFQVLLGLLTTVLGFAGVFAVFTYIEPILMRVSGYSDRAVSPILLVFGVGMIGGNVLGGRLADRRLTPALLGTLAALAAVLGLMGLGMHDKTAAVMLTGLLGVAAFATVSPLQLWVLRKAHGGEALASSLNIGAFNLGNAFGAWLGGMVIEQGWELDAVGWVAMLTTLCGFGVALFGVIVQQRAEAGQGINLESAANEC